MPRKTKDTPFVQAEEKQVVTDITSNTNLPVVPVENNNMDIATKLFNDRHAFQPHQFVPSLNLTEEQILQMHPMGVFERMVKENRIGLTNVPNVTRSEATAVVYLNMLQNDHMARALAAVEFGVHSLGMDVVTPTTLEYALVGKGEGDDRYLVAETRTDGWIQYSAYYGKRVWNDRGELVSFDKGGKHPIDQHNYDRLFGGVDSRTGVKYEGYNVWVGRLNAAVKAFAQGVATVEQKEMLSSRIEQATQKGYINDPNKFVQYNTLHLIDWTKIVNKFVLEVMLLQGDGSTPAFRIYSSNRTLESLVQTLTYRMDQFVKPYRNELRKFSGLFVADTEVVTE